MSIEHIMQGMALEVQPCCRCGEPNGLLVTDDPDGVKVYCFECYLDSLKRIIKG